MTKRHKKIDEPKKGTSTYYDAAFEDYEGTKRFEVRHPAHKNGIRVMAPDDSSAIVAAADFWGESWRAYSFYAYCEVTKG